jgi:glycosyltransferase involved in cell wall biosynthesis
VSVVLPVWNGERFLAEAIDSVIRQTFVSYELLVVDDGSTDTTRAIALEHAGRDARIIVIDRDHEGIAHALNAGIEAARGCYVARMDADDVALPSRLQKQIAFLDAHPQCVAVGSDLEMMDEEGEGLGAGRFPTRHSAIADALMSGSGSLAHPTVVMRRDAVRAVGGYRHDSFPSEDVDLWMRLSEIGELANIPEQLLRHRRHKGSVSLRERRLQRRRFAAIVDAARARHGLRSLKRGAGWHTNNDAATYHFDCARIALKSGNRAAALKHTRACISSAPFWPLPYAALAACVLPGRTLSLALRFYARLQTLLV